MDGFEVGVVRGRHIAILVVNLRFALCTQACPFVSVNAVIRLAFAGIRCGVINLQVINGSHGFAFRHLVFVVAKEETHVPVEIIALHHIAGQGQFKTAVAHGTVIERQGGVTEPFSRHSHLVGEQVIAEAVVELQRTGHPPGKKGKIYTDIDGRGLFPTQIRVWRRSHLTIQATDEGARVIAGSQIRSRILGNVTTDTIRSAELQHSHPIDIEERLAAEVPTGTY